MSRLSRVSRLLAVLPIALVPLAPLTSGVAGAQATDYERVVDITMPVSGPVRYSDDYDQDRGGGSRRHQATDLMGVKLQQLHATVDGTLCYINGVEESMPSWGYSLTICGDDGLEYRYLHINNDTPGTDDGLGGPGYAYAPGIRKGVAISRGQLVAYMGDSGNAEDTGAHLHFEIFDPELEDPTLTTAPYKQGRLNPFPSLESARQRGDVPGATTVPRPSPAVVEAPSIVEAPPATELPAPSEPPAPQPPFASPSPSPEPEPDPEPDPEPSPPTEEPVTRRAGDNRITTAVALSAALEKATTVVVVPAGSHTEALVSAPLAGLVGGPVLLSGPDGLDPAVAAEVERLGARSAYLVGRPDQLSAQVERDLTAAGITAQARLTAEDPAALSALVAREIASYGQRVDQVFVALGEAEEAHRAWPDALSASALAARLRAPVLLTGEEGRLPSEVAEVLGELRPMRVTLVGGTAAISEDVALRVARSAGTGIAQRLWGPNRWGTSVAVAEAGVKAGLDAPAVWVATGLDYPDALAAGPAAARAGAPLLLVDGRTAGSSSESDEWLSREAQRISRAVIVGGTAAITDEVRDAVAAELQR